MKNTDGVRHPFCETKRNEEKGFRERHFSSVELRNRVQGGGGYKCYRLALDLCRLIGNTPGNTGKKEKRHAISRDE